MKIFIYHPSLFFGGASVLFYRIFFFGKNLTNLYFIDCDGGFAHSRSPLESRILMCDDHERLKKEISDDDVIICVSSSIRKLKSEFELLDLNPRVLIWVVHPYEASIRYFKNARKITTTLGCVCGKYFINLFYSKYKKTRDFISRYEGDSIFFMDSAAVRSTNYFLDLNINEERSLLPIPYYESEALDFYKPRVKIVNISNLKIAYFGRVEEFKFPPVAALLTSIANSEICSRVSITIIGDGKGLDALKKRFEGKLDIQFLGRVENESAKRFMTENIDLVFAMGTAALDSSTLGIPTILLNPSNKESKQKFKWLYTTHGKNLGEYTDSPWFVDDGLSLEQVISDCIEKYDFHAEKSREYVENNHGMNVVFNQLMTSCQHAKLRINNIIKV